MKLKKLIKLIDFLTTVNIYTSDQEDDESPAYEGLVFDIPWVYMDMKIGRVDDPDEPIFIYTDDKGKSVMVINLIDDGT